MTEKKLYGAFFGPYLYDDATLIDDADSEFPSMYWDASVTNGLHLCAGIRFLDTDQTNYLTITWNEDDSANRTLQLYVKGGNRSVTLYENLTVADGYNISLQALGQDNAIIFNEGFTIGDGYAGTLTYSSACTLTVELNSVVNQDLTTDASPTFANCNLGTGELTTGSINRASGTLTLEIGGSAVVSVAATSVTIADGVSLALQEDITFSGATGVNLIKFPDNLADALSFKEGANAYMTFETSDENPRIIFGKFFIAPTNCGIGTLALGDGSITDSGGGINFDDEDLTTSGMIDSSGTKGLVAGSMGNTGKVVIYDGADPSVHAITITAPTIAADYTLTLPTTDGNADEVLKTDGAGTLSWVAAAGDVTAAAALTDNKIVRGDAAAKAVQTSGIGIDDSDNVSSMGTLGCGTITIADGSSLNLQEDITFSGATTENMIKFPDNLAVALSFKEGANTYITISTTNGSEKVHFSKNITTDGHITLPDGGRVGVPGAYIEFDSTNSYIEMMGGAKIGINVATPLEAVHLYAASANMFFYVQSAADNDVGLRLRNSEGNWYIHVDSGQSGRLNFYCGGDRISITTAGVVTLTATLNSLHILPTEDDTYSLGGEGKAWATISYHTLSDMTCAYFGDYSIKKLYDMFKQIQPETDKTLHYSEGSGMYFPHTDMKSLPEEFAWKASKDITKKLPFRDKKGKMGTRVKEFKLGESCGIDRTAQGDALIALVVKLYEESQDLMERLEKLELL